MLNNTISPSKKSSATWLLGICFLLVSTNMSAQINAYVGYVFSQNKDQKILNGIIERYNQLNPSLIAPMSTFKSLNGVDLGVRYLFPSVSFEFNWVNKFSQVHDQAKTADNVEYKNILYYKSQTFCLGTAISYEWLGIGASLDWNTLVMKKQKSTSTIKEVWLNQRGLSNHIFLNFEFDLNDAMALSIRPFAQLPLYKNDFYDFEAKLNPSIAASVDQTMYKQKVVNWGIKFLLVNGAKPR